MMLDRVCGFGCEQTELQPTQASAPARSATDEPDFPATGLRKTSYAVADQIRRVPVARLGKRLGSLKGALADAFEKWISD